MKSQDHQDSEQQRPDEKPVRGIRGRWLLIAAFAIGGAILLSEVLFAPVSISYTSFRKQLAAGNVKEVAFDGGRIVGSFKKQVSIPAESGEGKPRELTEFNVVISPLAGEELDKELDAQKVIVWARLPADYSGLLILAWIVIIVIVFLAIQSMRRNRDQMLGGGMISGVIKSPARRYEKADSAVSFEDVAGLDGVKRDLQEIVEFLKDPERFQRLGARVPRGVLLMGPPGTGKTLLARAVAGEADVPFFSISGSEFIQLFVGVGASRVRDLFKTAEDSSPAILFIDEIDAVGRERGTGLGGGHDEREQTLNQILSEMDGFNPASAVIVLAATNRPDVLDSALLRPGRFDRHITVDRPSLKGRRELFDVHSRNTPLSDDVDLERLAQASVGMTGADIRNLVNEAALWATRRDQTMVSMSDFEYARDKILMGDTGEQVLTEREREVTAYHEAGHALVAWLLSGLERVHKVTIIPRGRALGVTQLVPDEDRYNYGQQELSQRLAMLLGGRTAEQVVWSQVSAGAENDLKEATRLARRMVTLWGMSPRLGPVSYPISDEHPFLGREIVHQQRQFSEQTARVIDEEVARFLHEASEQAEGILTENRARLDKLAAALLEREELDEDEIIALIGDRVESTGIAASRASQAAAVSSGE